MKIKRLSFLRPLFMADEGGDGGAGGGSDAGTGGDNFDPEAAAAAAVADQNKNNESTGIDWNKVVPDDLKEQAWMKDILESENPTERFFKDMAGLQSKLGQRPEGIPDKDASEEDWNKFYNSLGRPESPDKYEIEPTKWEGEDEAIGKFIDETRGKEEFMTDVKALLHKAGLSNEKAQELISGYDKVFVKHNKQFFEEAVNAATEMQTDYEQQFKDAFKERAVEVQENGRKILDQTLPDNVKPMLQELLGNKEYGNKVMTVLAAALDGVNAKFIKEDNFNAKDTLAGGQGSEASRRAEATKLMAHPAFEDSTHPEYAEINRKVDALYGIKRTSSSY